MGKKRRVRKYLKDAEKLWPENNSKSDKKAYNNWLYNTAAMLMQKDDEQGLLEKNIAAELEIWSKVWWVQNANRRIYTDCY